MAATTATAALDAAARASDRRDGADCSPAYDHRRQSARVLPRTSNFPLTMAGPRVGSGQRPCWSRGRRRGTGGTRGRLRVGARLRGAAAGARAGGRAERRVSARVPAALCRAQR